MKRRTTKALTVLSVAMLACSATACASSSGEQRASAFVAIQKRGFHDVRFEKDDVKVPFGENVMYFTASLGECKNLELAVQPGQPIGFHGLSRAQLDSIIKDSPPGEQFDVAIGRWCKVPRG